MNTSICFDDSLPVFAALVQREWGEEAIAKNIFLRDVTGCLTFVVLDEKYLEKKRISLAKKATKALGHYVDGDGFSVATPDELFDDGLKDFKKARKIHLRTGTFSGDVFLIDRRMVGADWLRDVTPTASPPLRLVFASIKGGVGRSTALCVVAAHLSSKGRRVLAIDMDIEAPGLGNMLLPGKTLPEFGLLDYLVEQGLGPINNEFYADMVGSSWLGGGHGRVDVVPAIGQRSLTYPANVLAKIARAYLDGGGRNNLDERLSFMDHMNALLDRLADPQRYDIILIDARAGMHETTATAVVGLGAKVLFFGLDQPQTFAGYEMLFAHLATLLPANPDDDWRNRLLFIQAKASENSAKRETFSQTMGTLLRKYLWPVTLPIVGDKNIEHLKDTFEVDWADDDEQFETLPMDDDMPLSVLAILDDKRYSLFDPLTDRDSLSERAYTTTFGDLLEETTAMLDALVDEGIKMKV